MQIGYKNFYTNLKIKMQILPKNMNIKIIKMYKENLNIQLYHIENI